MRTWNRQRYIFPTRRDAENEVVRLNHQLTLHGIALYCIARNEITWTAFHRGQYGYRVRAGIARASGAHGGILFVEERFSEQGPMMDVFWAERFLHDMAEGPRMEGPDGKAWEASLFAAREILNAQQNVPCDTVQPMCAVA